MLVSQLSQAEVQHLDQTAFAHHHIARLEVSVYKTKPGGTAQTITDLCAELCGNFKFRRSILLQPFAQRGAVKLLHDYVSKRFESVI